MSLSTLDSQQVIQSVYNSVEESLNVTTTGPINSEAYDPITGTNKVSIPQAYDAVNGAIKVVPSSNTSFQVELSADDGDSVITKSLTIVDSFTITPATPLGIVLTVDATLMATFQIYLRTVSVLSGNARAQIQISPINTGTVWANLGATLNSTPAAGDVVAGAAMAGIAVRATVNILVAPIGGDVILYFLKR